MFMFQSTPPCEGATSVRDVTGIFGFQSTPPCEGATFSSATTRPIKFQSTPPCEGATADLQPQVGQQLMIQLARTRLWCQPGVMSGVI